MAQVISGNQVKLGNGQTVSAQQGGWYDGQQFYNGTLSGAGVINAASPQQGAGQAVSNEVIAQTNPNNVAYVQQQQAKAAANPNAPENGTPGASGPVAPPTAGGGAGLGGAFGGSTPTLNLPDLYTSLSKSAGISDLQDSITSKTQAFNDAQSKINDNPFLSEASRVGRVAKLTTDYNNDIKTTQDQLAMKQQDIQTQLDLQTKQFDINSQQSQQALSEFNTLLSSGALAGASGNDIAAITKATGISSGEIQAAITSQTAKDTPTAVQTVDDGTNQYAVVINTKTGQVISKTVLAASQPKQATAAQTNLATQQGYTTSAIKAVQSGVDLQTLMSNYAVPGGLSAEQILQLYNENSPYGQAKETLAQVKSGQFATNPTATNTPAKKTFSITDPSTWF